MLSRKIIQSAPIAWAANSAPVINMQFLDAGFEVGPNPRIARIWLQCNLNVTGGAGAAFESKNWRQFVTNLTVGDSGGDRFNGSGALLMDLAHYEHGSQYVGPPTVPNAAANTPIVFDLPLPIFPSALSARNEDFHIPLRELRDGARASILFGAATFGAAGATVTIVSGSVTVFADVRAQNGSKDVIELPPRLVALEYNAALTDDFYSIGGVPRFVGAYVGDATVQTTSPYWATPQRIESSTISLQSTPADVLQRLASFELEGAYAAQYLANASGAVDITSPITDPVRAGRFVPVHYSRRAQTIGDLPVVPGTMQYKTTLASMPTGAKIFISVIRKRCGNSASAGGYSSTGLGDAIAKGGAVQTPNGFAVPTRALSRTKVAYLPVTVGNNNPTRDGNC